MSDSNALSFSLFGWMKSCWFLNIIEEEWTYVFSNNLFFLLKLIYYCVISNFHVLKIFNHSFTEVHIVFQYSFTTDILSLGNLGLINMPWHIPRYPSNSVAKPTVYIKSLISGYQTYFNEILYILWVTFYVPPFCVYLRIQTYTELISSL